MNAVERIQHYIRAIPEEPSFDFGEDGYEPQDKNWPSQGTIEYKNVVFRYRENLPLVLKGISFSLPAGKKIGVVGRTGSGKSSLMMLLLRMYEIESGSILVDGENISKLSLHALRSQIGIVPQDPVLFSGTVRSNLDPFNQYTDKEIYDALSLLGMKEFILSLPAELSSSVLEYGSNFSQGQRQLFCLCRVLLKKPKILLLDEATSSIDAQTDSAIQQVISEHFHHTTVLTIAHRLNTVVTSDYILVLELGEVAAYGTPLDLLSGAGILSKEDEERAPKKPVLGNNPTIFAEMYKIYIDNLPSSHDSDSDNLDLDAAKSFETENEEPQVVLDQNPDNLPSES